MRDSVALRDICERIRRIRVEIAGPRGKSAFAKRLGIPPSTYESYESRRVPPAHLLVRIAELADVDLRWLLTGQAPAGPAVPSDHPALQRAAALLSRHPNAAGPLAAFVDLLAEGLKFPAKPAPAGARAEAPAAAEAEAQAAAGTPAAPEPGPRGAWPGEQAPPRAAWIPVLGRSAAGVPQFWSEADQAAGVTTLDGLIARHAGAAPRSVRPARAAGEDAAETTVQIILLPAPEAGEPAEFIAAPGLKARYADAFAVRLDGTSMTPEMQHGDLVVLSPSQPAADGRAAVVQLRRQIGVTCKLYRRAGDHVHLVPVNEQYAPQSYPAADVLWALRVLATVRSQ